MFADSDYRVRAVASHAEENYNEAGWDIVVEAMDNSAIYNVVKYTQSAEGAIAKMAAHVAALDSVRQDVINA